MELDFRCQGIVRDLILYICSQQRRIDIRKLVVRPISRRRRGRSLLSVYVHDDLLYLMVSFICLLASVSSPLYTYSTQRRPSTEIREDTSLYQLAKTIYETPKLTLQNPLTPPFKKKQNPGPGTADAWMPFGPGSCYQPGLKVLRPSAPQQPTWSPICPGSQANRD